MLAVLIIMCETSKQISELRFKTNISEYLKAWEFFRKLGFVITFVIVLHFFLI